MKPFDAYYLTIETERPIEGIVPGKVHMFGGQRLSHVVTDGCCVHGVLWTDKELEEVWDLVWATALISDPVRVSLAGKNAGRSWGAKQQTKTAIFESDGESRRWREVD